MKYIFKIIVLSLLPLFLNAQSSLLSILEKDYLSKKKELKLCIDPNWMPYEKNDDGSYIGISADYMSIIEYKLGIPIRMIPTSSWSESLLLGQNKECDIFSLVMKTKSREEFLNFTEPYVHVPLVLATKIEELFVDDLKKLENKKLGVVKDYAYSEILREKYPQLNLIDVNSIEDGLKKVQYGLLYGFIDSLYTTGYHIQESYVGQLKIAGKFDETWELAVGTRNDEPILNDIFNKLVNSLSQEEKQKISNKWLSIKYEKSYSKTLFIISILSIVIILIILFVNRKLSLEVKKRKEIENFLKLTIDGANLGTWRWYPQSNINIINENWAAILGYTKEEIDSMGDFFKLVHMDDVHKINEAYEKHVSNKKDHYETEFRMKAKDGTYKWIYSNGAIVQRDENNKPYLLTGIHQDITKRKTLEYEVLKQKDLFIQQSRQAAMGEMLENIAHQWRQPLSLITTAASSVKFSKEFGSIDDDMLIESMEQIIKSGNYLSETIDDFRGYFNKDKRMSEFNIDSLIINSTRFLKSRMKSANIELILEIENNFIYTYENELIQCMLNLFNNAVDAFKDSKLEEKYILVYEKKLDDKYIELVIQDSATGIDEEIINKIFEPYFTTKHQSQGTGIGLYMTKEIIEKHIFGSIKVENVNFQYNKKDFTGAKFTIKLPINKRQKDK